jgi:hypothetical protein
MASNDCNLWAVSTGFTSVVKGSHLRIQFNGPLGLFKGDFILTLLREEDYCKGAEYSERQVAQA